MSTAAIVLIAVELPGTLVAIGQLANRCRRQRAPRRKHRRPRDHRIDIDLSVRVRIRVKRR
jgi:hypothetical protein